MTGDPSITMRIKITDGPFLDFFMDLTLNSDGNSWSGSTRNTANDGPVSMTRQ